MIKGPITWHVCTLDIKALLFFKSVVPWCGATRKHETPTWFILAHEHYAYTDASAERLFNWALEDYILNQGPIDWLEHRTVEDPIEFPEKVLRDTECLNTAEVTLFDAQYNYTECFPELIINATESAHLVSDTFAEYLQDHTAEVTLKTDLGWIWCVLSEPKKR